MRFKEILSRLTGLNLGPIGASWKPPEPEVSKAKRIIAHLEDRRVLYNPSSLEVPEHCVQSIVEIRRFLTHELSGAAEDSPLTQSLRAMRAACRKFLDRIQAGDPDLVVYAWHQGHWASWEFNAALGELRGTFGVHLAQIASRYRIDIEDALASIMPAKDDAFC
jgi:hypothetical protein